MLSKKNSRIIDVEGQKYRWSVSGDSGFNVLVVQHAETNGQRLEILMPLTEESTNSPITPASVAQATKDALEIGWTPLKKAPPLELSLNADGLRDIRLGL